MWKQVLVDSGEVKLDEQGTEDTAVEVEHAEVLALGPALYTVAEINAALEAEC